MSIVVEATEVAVRFGQIPVLEGVELALHTGAELALVGRSGSGKTTLLLALAGLIPAQGLVRWPGLPADAAERRARIGVVFQAPSLVPELTAVQNVALPLRLRGRDHQTAYTAAAGALADVGLGDAGAALPSELSGGQQQRVALARVLAGDPMLLLADEPTGALDHETASSVVQVLRERVRRVGGALLVATHDDDLAALLPRQVELRDGRLHSAYKDSPYQDSPRKDSPYQDFPPEGVVHSSSYGPPVSTTTTQAQALR